MSQAWTYYADQRSRDAIGDGRRCTLLVGGYLGFPNFGDILQLKGALRAHSTRGDCTPVLILDIDAITDEGFQDRVRRQFGVEAIVFVSWSPVTGAPSGLSDDELPEIADLHVYGGGFLNRMWGDYVLSLVEDIHRRFGVSRYVMSGQQVETGFAARIRTHIDRCRPTLTGGRDAASTDVLRASGAAAAYSFDDAAEIVRDLAAGLVPRAGSAGPHLLLHMNASGYTHELDESERVNALLRQLDCVLERVGRDAPVTLMQAYTDRRATEIIDSLGVVQLFEDRSPLRRYQVLHLDRAALDAGVEGAPAITALSTMPTLALASSYHVSMLCAAMGVPCWMESRNGYYDQKRAGLGYGADESLEGFLASPRARDLGPALEARERWLAQFARAWDASGEPSARERGSRPETPARPWLAKRSAPALRAVLEATARKSEQRAGQAESQAATATEQLKASQALVEELDARLHTSEQGRDRMTWELEESRTLVKELDSRLHVSEQARDRMTWELESARAAHTQAAAQSAALQAEIAEATRTRERLELELSRSREGLERTEAALGALREDSARVHDALRREVEMFRAGIRDLSDRLAIARARVEMLQTLFERTKSRLSRIIA